jgi:hypothetical protein
MVWVYLVSRDGSDIEAQEWGVDEVDSLSSCPSDYCFTRFEDAKRDAIRRQKEELAFWTDWIQDNLERLHSLSAKDVKPKRSELCK